MQNFIQSKWMAFVPIVLTGVFVAFYAVSQSMFIECCPAKNTGATEDGYCKAGDGTKEGTCSSTVGCEGTDPSRVFSGLIDPFQSAPDWTKGPKQEQVKGKEILAKRFSGRFIWMFFASASVLFSLAAIGVFFWVVIRWRNWVAALVVGVVAVGIGVGAVWSDNMPVARPLFCKTIVNGVGGMTDFITINQAINVIGYTASAAMFLAIAAVLFCEAPQRPSAKPRQANKNPDYIDEFDFFGHPKEETPPEPKPSRKEILLEQMGHLKVILYVSTALLIVGVLRLNSGFTWSLSFMTEDTAKIAEGFLASVTTVLGGFFTLLLACTYLPSVYILWKRAEGEDMAEMEKKGFKFSFTESLPKILAIAAPLLTGPIAELLKNLAPK